MNLVSFLILFLTILVRFSNSLLNGEYSTFLIVAAFSNSHSSGKTSSFFTNSYLLTFPDDKADEIL